MICLGVGLLDFDLKAEKVEALIKEGEKAVQEAFDPEFKAYERQQNLPRVEYVEKLKTQDPSQNPLPMASTTSKSLIIGGLGVVTAGVIAAGYARRSGVECEIM